jgi:ankyrin repeat protein
MKLKMFCKICLFLASFFIFFTPLLSSDLNQKLVEAAYEGNLIEVERLIAEGADINAFAEINDSSSSGYTWSYTYTPLGGASATGHIEIVKLLIQNGADVNAGCQFDRTALMQACDYGNIEIVKLLIQNGAEINATAFMGSTALMDACNSGNLEIVKILLDNGALVKVKDNFLETALKNAIRKGHIEIVNLLLQHGANRADLVVRTKTQWSHCKNNNDYSCIDSLSFTFDNKSYSHISSITVMITIECDGDEIYKKEHTTGINLAHGEVGDCNSFQLANPVWACSGSDFKDNNKGISVYVEVLSVK